MSIPSDLPLKLKCRPKNVPEPTMRAPAIDAMLKKLKVSDNVRDVMKDHINVVGLDYRRFTQKTEDQVELLTELQVHVPSETTRDAWSKLTIFTSNRNKTKSKDKKTTYVRCRRLYQCQCGVDNLQGHQAGKKRPIGWKNVGCGFWIRLTTTHDENDPSKSVLLTIDEVVGDFTHSAECLNVVTMERNPRVHPHPELREYALALIRDRVPPPQLKQHCRDWSQNKWV